MKQYLLIAILFCVAVSTSAQIRSNRDLVGKWQGTDIQLEFFADYKVMMVVPGGRLPVATYTMDFIRNPIVVTITLTDNGQKMTYKGELEFINNETIRLQYHAENGNYGSNDSFEKEKTVTLKKKK